MKRSLPFLLLRKFIKASYNSKMSFAVSSFFTRKSVSTFVTIVFFILISILYIDQQLSLYFQRADLAQIQNFSRQITDIGLGEYWFGLALGCFLVSFLLTRHSIQQQILKSASMTIEKLQTLRSIIHEFGLTLFISLISSGIIIHIFKWSLGRQRPHKSELADPHIFIGFTPQWHFHSMPSGHSQVLFTVATCLALYFPKYRIPTFIIFALLAFTRVITIQHFLSDVIAGCFIGYATSIAIFYWRKNKTAKNSDYKN